MDDKGSPRPGASGGDDLDSSSSRGRLHDREPGVRPVSGQDNITTSGSGRRPPRNSPMVTTGGGQMRVMSRADANLPVPDVTQVPAEASGKAKRKIVAVEARLDELQAQEELALRRPALLERVIERLPDDNAGRQLLVALADSFFSQLVIGLIGTVLLIVTLHAVDPSARFAGPFLYLWFLGAALYFARFKPHHSLMAASGLCITGFLMFTISTGSGATLKPLLAFKPTALFWLSTCLVSAVATSLHNRHVEDLLERRVALLALQRQIREKEEQAGRAQGTEKIEEQINQVKDAHEDRKKEVSKYSTIFLQMQRLSRNLAPDELFQTIWEILKHSMEAAEVQIYVLRGNALEGVAQFKLPEEKKNHDPTQAFAEAMVRSPEVVPREEFQHPFILVGPDSPSIFSFVADKKRNLFSDDIKRDRMLEQLAAKSPLPVAFCFPLIDAKNNTIKGIVNVARVKNASIDDEMRKMVRAVADVAAMAMTHWEALETERGKKLELKKLFSTLVSPSIVQQLMDNPNLAEPRRQKITVVFVDLRGFTNISEANSPAVVVELLADFFGRLTPLIFKFDGTLDKYIGDEIMALWGAPANSPLDARKAVLASWEMREAFTEVQERWAKRLGKPPNIGIAINTGEAMVGLIGSESQRNYTAIGDAVNTAARLEGCTGAGKIYVTRSTYEEVQGMCELVKQESQRVQGKAEALEMWEVVAVHPDRLETAPLALPAAPAPRTASSRDLARAAVGATSSADALAGAIGQARVPDVTQIPGGALPTGADVTAIPRAAAPAQRRTGTVPALAEVPPEPPRAAIRPPTGNAGAGPASAEAQAAMFAQAAQQAAPQAPARPPQAPQRTTSGAASAADQAAMFAQVAQANQPPPPERPPQQPAPQRTTSGAASAAEQAAMFAQAAQANQPPQPPRQAPAQPAQPAQPARPATPAVQATQVPGAAPSSASLAQAARTATPMRTTGSHPQAAPPAGGVNVSNVGSSAHGAGAPQPQAPRVAPAPSVPTQRPAVAPGPAATPRAPNTVPAGTVNPRKPDGGT